MRPVGSGLVQCNGRWKMLAVSCPIGFFKFPLRGFVDVMAVVSI